MNDIVSFRVSIPQPHSHLLSVEMDVPRLTGDESIVRMPVWTPGSYLIREYPKHVQQFEAVDETGADLAFEKIDKASWRIDTGSADRITVRYRVYGHEISPRHNHVDGTHAFFNCVATCMYPDGRLDERVAIDIDPPRDWEIFCGLEPTEPGGSRFVAPTFDVLFDTPVEIGPHDYFDFEVQGIPHRFVVWSDDDFDFEPFRRDLPEIIEENISIFGEIPYERFLFINHVVPDKWGGLEHCHSCVNVFRPEDVAETSYDEHGELTENYANVLRLFAHEHFHTYHIKRLRPEELGPFDYQRENYTRSLWAIEGMASYYDNYQLRRADLISPGQYIDLLERRIEQLHRVPGRHLESLEEASFNAWIGLYQKDENTRNSSVSYYLKGELVVWLMDLWVRHRSDGERTMDDVLRRLWREYYIADDVGFPRGAVEEAIEAETEASARQLFDELVRGCESIGWEDYLGPVGLQLAVVEPAKEGWLGFDATKSEGDHPVVEFVERESTAEKAGIYAGDEVVAVDGRSAGDTDVDELVAMVEPGDTVELHLMRRQRMHCVEAVCTTPPPEAHRIERCDDASSRQLKLLRQWLGATEWTQ